MKIIDFARINNFDSFMFAGLYKGKEVFNLWNKEDEGLIIGLPTYAIKENDSFRIPIEDGEIFSIMDSLINK